MSTTLTLEDNVRPALKALSKAAGDRKVALKLLKDVAGVDRLEDLDEGKFQAVVDAAQAAIGDHSHLLPREQADTSPKSDTSPKPLQDVDPETKKKIWEKWNAPKVKKTKDQD